MILVDWREEIWVRACCIKSVLPHYQLKMTYFPSWFFCWTGLFCSTALWILVFIPAVQNLHDSYLHHFRHFATNFALKVTSSATPSATQVAASNLITIIFNWIFRCVGRGRNFPGHFTPLLPNVCALSLVLSTVLCLEKSPGVASLYFGWPFIYFTTNLTEFYWSSVS